VVQTGVDQNASYKVQLLGLCQEDTNPCVARRNNIFSFNKLQRNILGVGNDEIKSTQGIRKI